MKDEGGSEPESPPIRVLVADDHPMIRAGARAMLNSEGIEVVGEAATGKEAIDMVMALAPDVVLMDVQMPDIDGLEATREIKSRRPVTAVIVVTGSDERAQIRSAVEAGATGYLLKGAPREVLLQAVKLVQSGGSLIDGSLLSALAEDANAEAGETGKAKVGQLIGALSPRELEVLRHLAAGLTNKEIAQEMHYSIGTVKNVVQRIIEKLGVSDRTQAAVYAVRAGVDVD